MKKRLTAIILIYVIISACSITAFADVHYIHDVTMSVTDEVINTTSEKLFGFNQEWNNNGVRRNLWLHKNYAKYTDFANDFENKDYYEPAPSYGEAYFTPGSSASSKYINNGDAYHGNASYTSYMVAGGQDLYDNQYTDGVLNHPTQNVTAGSGIEPVFSYVNKDILKTGGLDGFVGFNAFYEIKSEYKKKDIEDLTVVNTGGGNHALKLSPERGYEYTESNKEKKGIASFFGKDNLALIDRRTTLEYKINITSEEADFRQSIAKDCNFDKIADAAKSKYVNALTLQFVKESSTEQKRGWYDCLKFKNGEIFMEGEAVGAYERGVWYTVRYTLDICDGISYINTLSVLDSQGNIVCNTEKDIALNDENSISDIYYITRQIGDPFEFASRSDYGYIFSSYSGKDAEENSTVYIDDISFITEKYYDNPESVLNESVADFEEYPFEYTRVAGGSANAFKWKKSIGDARTRERYSRQRTSNYVAPTRAVWGIPEWYELVNQLSPKAEFSYVINLHDSDEDITDLIEFMTADGDINGDGEDWAQIRRDNGISEPLRIYMWEIGNEPNINYMDVGTWEKYWDVDSYIERCGEIISLLEKYCPQIKIAVPVNTGYMQNIYGRDPDPSKNWDKKILAQPWAENIDYFSYHSYNEDRAYPIDLAIDNLKKSIEESGNTHVKIAYSEHGTSRSNNSENEYQGVGLASALVEAQFFNRIFREPIVETANMHSYTLYPARWGIGYEAEDGSFKAGANYELMKMYSENAIGDVLYTVMDGFEPEQTTDKASPNYIAGGWNHTEDKWIEGSKFGYSCSAVRQKDGSISLFISNSRNHTLNLSLDMSSAFDDYEIAEHSVITGKREEDIITSWDGYVKMLQGYNEDGSAVYSTQYAEDMVYTTDTEASKEKSITIMPYSVNLIKLKNTKPIVTVAEFQAQERCNITGFVKKQAGSNVVTLSVRNKETGEECYSVETTLDEESSFSFNAAFPIKVEQCNIFIGYCGSEENVSESIHRVTDTEEMFEISTEIQDETITATINNKFNFPDVSCVMLSKGTLSCGAFGGSKISQQVTLLPGETIFSVPKIKNCNIYDLYFWGNLKTLKPVLNSRIIGGKGN